MDELPVNESPDYYSAHRADMVKYIPPGTRTLLEVGCGEGYFGKLIKEKFSAEVWGVELMGPAAEKASSKIDSLLVGKIEALIPDLPDSHFDCIVFNDVLEHLLNPWEVISDIKPKLSADGVIVASIPNFRYWPNLQEILWDGEWDYQDHGVLDITHIRFFTLKSIRKMFESAGYEIITLEGFDVNEILRLKLLNFFTKRFSDLKYLHFACVARAQK